TVIPLPEGGALKLTTALYYTPSGRSIQAEGIAPDLVVPEFKLSAPAAAENLSEANLEGHFTNNAPTPQAEGNLLTGDQLAQQDFQLYSALNVLKGLTIAGGN
ncbi:MAG: peptidase S41, partial [Gammaproteobacteria bacterium]|nr:peptidase S41 [Gammaproteobacteria bacterium]